MKIKILGISASPRKNGNTDYMVKMALLAARQIKDVETEFIRLGDYKYVSGCIDCKKCDHSPGSGKLCQGVKDDHNKIMEKEFEANGFIWGTPVYFQGVTSQWKMWADRHECFIAAAPGQSLRNKPVGCVTLGACRSGGQVQTIEDMFRVAYILDMIPIGAAVVSPSVAGAGIHGACAIQAGWPEIAGQSVIEPEAKDWVKYDRLGISNCLVIGERVAEMAKVIESGFTLCNPENGETRWPAHALGPEYQNLDLINEYEDKGLIPRIERKGSILSYVMDYIPGYKPPRL